MDTNLLTGRDAGNVTASAAVLPFQEITDDNIILFHATWRGVNVSRQRNYHRPHDTKSATILRGRYEDPKATVQLLVPKQVLSRRSIWYLR